MRLADKVVLITGSGRGIGRATALAFAAAGAKVVMTSRTEKDRDIGPLNLDRLRTMLSSGCYLYFERG